MSYSSIEEAMADLRKRGYTADFTAETELVCLYCGELDMRLDPTEFQIDEIYRYDCNPDSDNNTLRYAISDPATGVKGTLVDAPRNDGLQIDPSYLMADADFDLWDNVSGDGT